MLYSCTHMATVGVKGLNIQQHNSLANHVDGIFIWQSKLYQCQCHHHWCPTTIQLIVITRLPINSAQQQHDESDKFVDKCH